MHAHAHHIWSEQEGAWTPGGPRSNPKEYCTAIVDNIPNENQREVLLEGSGFSLVIFPGAKGSNLHQARRLLRH